MSRKNKEQPEETTDIEIEDSGKPKKKFRFNIHIVMITIIVVILGVSGFKLYSWNHGETIEYDPEEDTSEFDVEKLDEIIPIATNAGDGHTYDDETTVLLLGNGSLSFSRNEDFGLADRIADAAGVTVYNGSFPYVTLATKNLAMIEENYPDDIYSLSYIADAITTGDFTEIERVTGTYHEDGTLTKDGVSVLKSVDYDNLDVIVIMYDAMDYFEGRAIENPSDDEERCTIVGSLNYSIRKIKEAYPYIRIIVSSPFYVEGIDADGNVYDPDMVDAGNGTLSNYVYNELNTAVDLSVSFLDNFYGTINQDNYTSYVEYDTENGYIHLNDNGEQALANRIAYAIQEYPNDK